MGAINCVAWSREALRSGRSGSRPGVHAFPCSGRGVGLQRAACHCRFCRIPIGVVRIGLNAGTKTAHIVALAHITGGGFPDNLPRVLPSGLGVSLDLSAFDVPPVFRWLAETGDVTQSEMLRVFNCGIGMAVVASEPAAGEVEAALRAVGEKPLRIGEIIETDSAERVVARGTLAL